jgi:capsular exopolysaccharide synthesis family protein
MTKYGPNHPDMRKVRAEVQEARAGLDAEMERLIASVRNDYEVAEERERQLTANLDALKGQEVDTKSASVELKELEREAATSKQLFEALLTRYKQTTETQGLQLPDARIVERADAPLFPAFPKRKQLAIVGFAGGLAAAIALALVLELMTPGIGRLEDVEHVLEITHLSSLPRTQAQPHAEIEPMRSVRLVVADPAGAFAEAIRGARREIDIRRHVGAPRIILVASSLPGEGSGVVASNLAHHYALTGTRVLLIDGDLRRATLSRQLATQRQTGLVEALGAGTPVEHGILRDATTGLHFLPAMGPAPVRMSSPEMLQSPTMQASLAGLRRQFDTIIIDAPPLLPVIDGRILADQADQLVFVLAWQRTPRQLAKRALKSLGFNQEKVLGVVVSEVAPEAIADAAGFDSQPGSGNTLGRAA